MIEAQPAGACKKQHDQHQDVIQGDFVTIAAGLETIWQMDCKYGYQHGDDQGNSNKPCTQPEDQQDNTEGFGCGGQVSIKFWQNIMHAGKPLGNPIDILQLHHCRAVKANGKDDPECQ